MKRDKPLLAVTMGDPSGVGPELVVKVATNPRITDFADLVLVGNTSILREAVRRFNPSAKLSEASNWTEVVDFIHTKNSILCLVPDSKFAEETEFCDIKIGKESSVSGRIAYDCVVEATQAVIDGHASAIVTAPVNKAAINRAGVVGFSGHTELVAQMSGCTNFSMQQSSGKFHVSFVTTHIPLRDVVKNITQEKIIANFKLLHQGLIDEGITNPKIAVAAINPHAGENGYMGDEDIKITTPAIKSLQDDGYDVEGPFPPDTLFIPVVRERFDGIVCMYHDQGHIPFKMIAFDTGVNSTLGLPIIRTSVDHGTAFNLAWQGTASEESLIQALKLATIKSLIKKKVDSNA